MVYLLWGVFIYVMFFIVLPGIGAVSLRRRWDRFRKSLFRYSQVPVLGYNNLEPMKKFSFKGELESFRNDNVVWLRGETISLCIDLNKQNVYTLSKNSDKLIRTRWSNVSSLVEGTMFYVFGTLVYDSGIPYLVGNSSEELIVVVCDEDSNIYEDLFRKARDKNEIWNSFSPYLYITGVFILIILSYISYTSYSNKTWSYYLLLGAGTPFYFFIPPGLIFYLQYRKTWDKAIRYLILKDLKLLRGDFYGSEMMAKRSKSREIHSLLLYLLGYLVNTSIAGIILFRVYQLIIYS